MSPSPAVEHFLETFESLRAHLPGAGRDWPARLRTDAAGRFAERGIPTPRDEDWRYTRLAALERRRFEPAPAAPATPPAAAADAWSDAGGTRLVFVDGAFCESLSRLPDDAGTRVGPLSGPLDAGETGLRAHLGRYADGAFASLNTAFLRDGALVEVAEGAGLDQPLELVFLAGAAATDTVSHPRVLLRLGAGSRATVVETFAGCDGQRRFTNAITEAVLEEGAALEHVKLQAEDPAAYHISTLQVQQAAGSRFRSHSFSLGAALARHDVNSTLAGEGAACVLNGLYFGAGRQHVDYHTRVDHASPGCTSEEDYRGVLAGHAHGVFNGRVIVHRDAQRSDARQSNANLLLSADAEVDTKPQLEIHADDVKCAHGATVGQLDPAMLFYLRSRGIDESSARAMLTLGFARDLVDRVEHAPLRERIARELAARMPGGARARDMMQ